MPAVQTTYASNIAPARPGQIADERTSRRASKLVQTNPIAFGAPVFRGTIDNGIMAAGTTGAGACIGIAVIAPEERPSSVYAPDTYQPGDIALVLESGPIWVTTTSATTPGAAVYVDSSGNITATSTGNTAMPNSVFSTTTAAGGLARIFIRVG